MPRTGPSPQEVAYGSLHRRYVLLLYALQAAPMPSEDAEYYERWYREVRRPALQSAERRHGAIVEQEIGRRSLVVPESGDD